ncbi:hypothetical protein WK54_07685 [Burkholderia ubonensis]|nr:hypothetical protein WK54_07685 [Burkholderia ubonensis]
MFCAVPDVTIATGPALALNTSPTLPAFALSAAVVPLMPFVDEGVMRPVALIVVNAPLLAVVDPIEPGAANVAPPSVAALMLVLQPNPVPKVYETALLDVEQLVMLSAVRFAVEPVALPRTVFAPTCARFANVIPFVRLWNAYAPAPVRVRNPVLLNPVMLSSAVPLADETPVPPDETASGWLVNVAVP